MRMSNRRRSSAARSRSAVSRSRRSATSASSLVTVSTVAAIRSRSWMSSTVASLIAAAGGLGVMISVAGTPSSARGSTSGVSAGNATRQTNPWGVVSFSPTSSPFLRRRRTASCEMPSRSAATLIDTRPSVMPSISVTSRLAPPCATRHVRATWRRATAATLRQVVCHLARRWRHVTRGATWRRRPGRTSWPARSSTMPTRTATDRRPDDDRRGAHRAGYREESGSQ